MEMIKNVGLFLLIFIIGELLVFGFYCLLSDDKSRDVNPPRSVNLACMIEVVFGGFIAFSSLCLALVSVFNICSFLVWFSVGVGWMFLSVRLRRGSRIARWLWLPLSLLRLVTVLGAPFTLVAIWLLFFTETSRQFFGVTKKLIQDDI